MSTTSTNTEIKQGTGRRLEYPILKDGTADINQGDNVYFDTSAKVVKALDSNANAATFAGVATDKSYAQLYATKTYLNVLPVAIDGIWGMKSVNGQTYNHGDAVYFSTDAQTVTPTDPGTGHIIGYVWLQNGGSAIVSTGVETVPILIVPLFPVSGGL
jgi:predicted RecA/RadA family phage recombinase